MKNIVRNQMRIYAMQKCRGKLLRDLRDIYLSYMCKSMDLKICRESRL